ncbi:dolichyl-phosphate beta-glucosyltransferase [Spirillospora sp. CA-294931]|uniref:dolichyl-phosphate beta-glucosyltransferase n=1 Tax=Spirillospora sp. CA-294931 TaxID=3240042 RepID=UPI003D914079
MSDTKRAPTPPRRPSDEFGELGVELSVVIPAFNEEHRLRPTVEAVARHLRARPGRWEVIVVDDGSTDATAAVAALLARREPSVRLIRTPSNRGKGHAVRCGVLASRGRHVLFTDADLPTPIEELDRLRSALSGGAGAAIGARTHREAQGAVRRLLGRAGSRLIRTLSVPAFSDTQCGFKLFDGAKARTVFGLARIDGWGFDVEILRLFARFGWTVAEVPVRWVHRPGSTLRPSAYLHTLADLYRIHRDAALGDLGAKC